MARRALLFGVVLLVTPVADLAACDSTGCLLTARGQSPLLREHSLQVDVSFRYVDNSRRLQGTDDVATVLKPWVDFRDGSIWPAIHEEKGGRDALLQVDVGYGITRRLSAFASLPLRADRAYESGDTICGLSIHTRGLGDALLGLRRALVITPRAQLFAGIAAKIPTGRSRITSRTAPDVILEPSLQPGTGSLDWLSSVQYAFRTHPTSPTDWLASASYQVGSTNGLGYRFGNEAILGVTASRRLGSWAAVSLQAKVFDKARSAYHGERLDSTGARFVYVTPGFRVRLPDSSSLYALFQVPVYGRVNESQLAPARGLLVGVNRTF